MDYCFISLILASIFWSIQPIFNARVADYYESNDYSNMGFAIASGFIFGMLGTACFIVGTKLCDSLSQSVAYTYALPIIFTSVASIIIYNETLGVRKWAGIVLILFGLYLMH